MEFNDIQKLMAEFEKSSTRELKIDDNDFHLYLSKNETSAAPVAPQAAAAPSAPAASAPAEPASSSASASSIKAPLVGTVYLQPKPNKPTFVKVGDKVQKGDVVCVIEAMKMLTEVKSDRDGVIKEINVENGDLVEFDQPLFTLTEG
ncbi:MAG: acetyl-CoA carboxylase biotin carboxyl carrier protein [Limosilactobacillus sp.]|uniref:acetyl-CoA carboxylase biotin carboxyl carrier protein n=1 Tax=Limosilactobacillus sp. TaxID=2773925 RepID=UPI0026F9959B|nr:acetyl-CoA carboxylase biotin carboxyl carrier protein [Limosilactobacillus sp.]